MADQGAAGPFDSDRRYEALSGGREQRSVYYLARRRLGLSVREWDALPWWQSRLYLEGLSEEFTGGDDHRETVTIDASSTPLGDFGFGT